MEWNGYPITVKPRWDDGWQRFIASCQGISDPREGPFGFGKTEQAAIDDLLNELRRLTF